MSARLALRLARAIIRAVAVLVPGVARADWVREWHAELHHQSHHRSRQQPFTWRTHMALITRALGALPDAAWLRRQFTLDADAVHDAGHAVRMLVKTPGFTAIALLVFAVGIGATTAIVSIADALFMRPMAVPQPERVITLWQHNRETGAGRQDVAPGNALDWMERARSFEAVAMAEPMRFNTNFAGREPDYVYAAIVGEQFFTRARDADPARTIVPAAGVPARRPSGRDHEPFDVGEPLRQRSRPSSARRCASTPATRTPSSACCRPAWSCACSTIAQGAQSRCSGCRSRGSCRWRRRCGPRRTGT